MKASLSSPQELLGELLFLQPFQPATALWRSIEIHEVLQSPFPEGRGLDLGCGDGHLTKIILDRAGSRSLVGVDIDPQETATATKYETYDRIHTTTADRIPEPDSHFDFVFSNSVLEHIDNVQAVLAEVARVLRTGGLFLFTVPSANFHELLRGPVLPFGDRSRYLRDLDDRLAHLRYWSESQWEKELGMAGLTIQQSSYYLNARQLRRWETVSRFTAGILYSLVGKKKSPIQIQRSLGLRTPSLPVPRIFCTLVAHLLCRRLKLEKSEEEKFGGLSILARKE